MRTDAEKKPQVARLRYIAEELKNVAGNSVAGNSGRKLWPETPATKRERGR